MLALIQRPRRRANSVTTTPATNPAAPGARRI